MVARWMNLLRSTACFLAATIQAHETITFPSADGQAVDHRSGGSVKGVTNLTR